MPEQSSEKVCTRCGESRPLVGGFYRNGPRLSSWCKECQKANSRAHNRRKYVPAPPRPTGEGYDYIVDAATGCWVWRRERTGLGYGVARVDGKRGAAHRYMYEQLVGPIPEGLVLDHLCRNPPCVNPAHLEPVQQSENCRRGLATKLTRDEVIVIYNSPGTRVAIARRFGVDASIVSRIKSGHRWADVTGAKR